MATWEKKIPGSPGDRKKWADTNRCIRCDRRLSDRRYKYCATCSRRGLVERD